MTISRDDITRVLRNVRVPADSPDIISSRQVRSISVSADRVSIELRAAADPATTERLRNAARAAIEGHLRQVGVPAEGVVVEVVDAEETAAAPGPSQAGAPAPGHRPIHGLGLSRPPTPQAGARPLPQVKNTIAVGAGKGGVGKSTVALNLAVGLARKGHAVGLMDGDIYGPSMPTLLNLHPLQTTVLAGMLQPFLVHGIKVMTIGKLVEPDKPLIWRGPMAHGAFKQLTEQTNWGELDYLVIDLPPGTGDVPLTMAQMLQLTGAVIVCTPQRVAQDDAVRATRMFQQLGIQILGVVENMSVFIGDDGKEYDIFGRGGAQAMAQRLNVPFLGELPLTMALRKNSDQGDPTANFTGVGSLAASLDRLVEALQRQAALAAMRLGTTTPTLTIS